MDNSYQDICIIKFNYCKFATVHCVAELRANGNKYPAAAQNWKKRVPQGAEVTLQNKSFTEYKRAPYAGYEL